MTSCLLQGLQDSENFRCERRFAASGPRSDGASWEASCAEPTGLRPGTNRARRSGKEARDLGNRLRARLAHFAADELPGLRSVAK